MVLIDSPTILRSRDCWAGENLFTFRTLSLTATLFPKNYNLGTLWHLRKVIFLAMICRNSIHLRVGPFISLAPPIFVFAEMLNIFQNHFQMKPQFSFFFGTWERKEKSRNILKKETNNKLKAPIRWFRVLRTNLSHSLCLVSQTYTILLFSLQILLIQNTLSVYWSCRIIKIDTFTNYYISKIFDK